MFLPLEMEATNSSEMAAAIYRLTKRRVQEDINRFQHWCENMILHHGDDIFFLQCIFIVYKITAVFMCDENNLRCHHALRRKLSPNQFIICGE